VIIGFMVKEPAVMFVPLLMVYKLLFEMGATTESKHPFHPGNFLRVLKQCILPVLMVVVLFMMSRQMTPEHWTSGNTDRWSYLISQPYVIIHYFNNFFLPFNLVIDTDWEFVPAVTDDRFIIGFAFIVVLFVCIIKMAPKHPLISFGLSWFLLALLPTSSIFPLAEVLNDHRPFFAYIGLCIVVVYLLAHVFKKYKDKPALKMVGATGI